MIPKKRVVTTKSSSAPPRRAAIAAPEGGSFISGQGTEQLPKAIIILGKPGQGKSSFAAEFPNPIFICDDEDQGVRSLRNSGVIPNVGISNPICSWQDLFVAGEELLTIAHGYSTAVFEGIVGFEKFCHVECCDQEYDNNWARTANGFNNFSSGAKLAAKKYWPLFLGLLKKIRASGMHVIVTGHVDDKPIANMDGDDFTGCVPCCDKATWYALHRWAEAVLVMDQSVSVIESGLRKKAGEASRRIMLTTSPIRPSKNQWGMQMDISADGSPAENYQQMCKQAGFNPTTLFFE